MKSRTLVMSVTLVGLLGSPWSARSAWAQGARGIALFEEHCATCHTAAPNPDTRAPSRDALRQRTPEAILEALTMSRKRL